MKKKVLSILFIVLEIGFAIASFVLLPEEVIIQIGLDGKANTVVPKLLAVIFPFVLGSVGAIYYFKTEDTTKIKKSIALVLVSYLVYIVCIIMNKILV